MAARASSSLVGTPPGLQQPPAMAVPGHLEPLLEPEAARRVQEAVSRYLKDRNYVGGFAESFETCGRPPKPTESLGDLAFRQVVYNETCSNDVVGFSSAEEAATDPRLVEAQYAKFKIWISESPDSYKPELAQLLYPLFTHLYLGLVADGKKADAQKFYRRHQSTFLGNVEFAQFIRLLGPIQSLDDLRQDQIVSAYFESRYSVTLSNKTFLYLMEHLMLSGNPLILLDVLRSKVDLRLADALGSCSKAEAVQRIKNDLAGEEAEKAEMAEVASKAGKGQNGAEDRLRQVIKVVRESCPTPKPSVCLFKLLNETAATTCSSISPDVSLMATGSEDSSVTLWDLLPPAPQDFGGSGGPADNGDNEDDELDRAEESENPAAIVPLSCDMGRRGPYWSSRKARARNRRILRAHSKPVYDAAFVPPKVGLEDGSIYLLSVSGDRTVRLWNASRGVNKAIYEGHSYAVWCVDVDRVGACAVTGSMDKTAKLWQLEYTFPVRMYAGHESDVDAVKFHPNCNYLATGSADKTVRLWSHADAKMVRIFNGNKAGIFSLAFSPDGKYLAAGGEDRVVRVWDIATANLLKELKGHRDIVYSLVWSQDSSLISSAGLDGTIRIWDLSNAPSESLLIQQQPLAGFIPGGGDHSREMVACYPTSCANIIDLCYSPHQTLMATGVGSSSSMYTARSGLEAGGGGPHPPVISFLAANPVVGATLSNCGSISSSASGTPAGLSAPSSLLSSSVLTKCKPFFNAALK